MTTQPETFDQFYARISANRKAEIVACVDPVKRAELEAWDTHFEAQWKAAWQIEEGMKAGFQSSVTAEEQRDRRDEFLRENPPSRERSDFDENSTYLVVNGRAS